SSKTSRTTPSPVVSPNSRTPPGSDQLPSIGSRPRRINRTSPPLTTTPATPTIGADGYSRPTLDSSPITSEACQTLRRTPCDSSRSVRRRTCQRPSDVQSQAAPPPNSSTAAAEPHAPSPARTLPSEPCHNPSPRPSEAYG